MRDAGQRLVHRHMHVGIAGDALHVAERLLHRLAERDADVLGGVVVVDVQVALGLDRDVDARMPRQQIEHVVEEADAGRDRRTRPVPSRSTATSMSVSLVLRFTAPLRMAGSSSRAMIALSSRPFIRGLPRFATIAAGRVCNTLPRLCPT